MKYLIQHTFSVQNPYYIIPNGLNKIWGKKKINELFRIGVGKQDDKLFAESKYDGTEITGIITGIFKKDWEFNKNRIKKYKEGKYPIEVFHACTAARMDNSKNKNDWNLNLAKDNDITRRGIANSIYLGKELIDENPIINFHMGKFPKSNNEVARKSLIKNLKFAAQIAQEEQVTLTVENDYKKRKEEEVFGKNAEEIKKILDEVGSEYIGVCFDWGHANVQARNEFKKENLSEKELSRFSFLKNFIRTLGPKIYYAHIHYNLAHLKEQVRVRSIIERDNWDLHMPPNKVRKQDEKDYLETLKLLKDKTSINKCGKIMLELTRDKMFRFVPFNKYGANTEDALESLEMVRSIFE